MLASIIRVNLIHMKNYIPQRQLLRIQMYKCEVVYIQNVFV